MNSKRRTSKEYGLKRGRVDDGHRMDVTTIRESREVGGRVRRGVGW